MRRVVSSICAVVALSLPLSAVAGRKAPPAKPDASTVEGAPPAPAAAVALSPSQQALLEALSVREPAPPCDSLAGLTSQPVADYQHLAETVHSPPWVGTRAAECLVVGHHAQAQAVLRVWLTDPRRKGFGWVVLGHLDALPTEDAVALATLAITEGPDPEGARKRIARSKKPELKAVAAH